MRSTTELRRRLTGVSLVDLAANATPKNPAPSLDGRARGRYICGMADGEKSGKTPKAARAERLAEALRENLRRRKAQARGRKAAKPDDDGAKGPENRH